MKLVVDIGNTLAKAAIFEKEAIVELSTAAEFAPSDLLKLIERFPDIHSCILSSVRDIDENDFKAVGDKVNFFILSHQTPLPFVNTYETPLTLGKDRIAAVAAGMLIYPKSNVLVIDAGTCITYDMITAEREYVGGGISPGIFMRFKAMHTFTGKLPLIKPEFDLDIDLIGKTTKDALLAGGQKAILMEVEGMINAYKERYDDLKVVIGGGDYKYFDKYLKNNIFAAPNLVLVGLKKILDFNED